MDMVVGGCGCGWVCLWVSVFWVYMVVGGCGCGWVCLWVSVFVGGCVLGLVEFLNIRNT